MVLCFVALGVFAILGIFSARHRKLAKEAFDCVMRKTTFRRCNSNLDARLKATVTGKFFKLHPKIGTFTYKYFDWLSWAFTILLLVSLFFAIQGGVYFVLYGNCNGLNEAGFCVFDPTGGNTGVSEDGMCIAEEFGYDALTLEDVDLSTFITINNGGQQNTVVFLGCYACPYTRDGYDTIMRLADRTDTNFYFAHYPTKGHTEHITPILNCVDEQDGDIRKFNEVLFTVPAETLDEQSTMDSAIEAAGLDPETVMSCAESPRAQELAEHQLAEIHKTFIYGTPLVFVNGEPVVGPRPYRVYWFMLER